MISMRLWGCNMADGVLPSKKEFTKELNIDNLDSMGTKIIKEIEDARNKKSYL
jgi:hypothetical protein